MTEILVARRNGMLTAPDGTKHRLVRGKTFADARHPAAAAYPEAFVPFEVQLPYDDSEAVVPPGGDRDATEKLLGELVDARAEAADYREQLSAIVVELANREGLPGEKEMTVHGWLVRAIAEALDNRRAGPDDVSPAAPRKRAPRPAR